MASPVRHAWPNRCDRDDYSGFLVAVWRVVPERTQADDGGKRGSSSFQTHAESLGERFVVACFRKEADADRAGGAPTWLAET